MLKVANSVINASQIATPITFAGDVTLSTGNLVIGTSGKGIDFSITSSGSGTMTSELLADYEEGTWTPTDASGAGLTLTVVQATYTKIGRLVTAQLYVTYPANVNGTGAAISLPFTPSAALTQAAPIVYTNGAATMAAINTGITYMALYAGVAPVANGTLASKFIIFSITYSV